jgi:hypothetical protein
MPGIVSPQMMEMMQLRELQRQRELRRQQELMELARYREVSNPAISLGGVGPSFGQGAPITGMTPLDLDPTLATRAGISAAQPPSPLPPSPLPASPLPAPPLPAFHPPPSPPQTFTPPPGFGESVTAPRQQLPDYLGTAGTQFDPFG